MTNITNMDAYKFYTKTKFGKVVILTLVIISYITSIPYVLVKGLCNREYYEEWLDIVLKQYVKIFHKK